MTGAQQETAIFVAQLCRELRKLTEGAMLDPLTYLLDMAVLEASRVSEPRKQIKSAA